MMMHLRKVVSCVLILLCLFPQTIYAFASEKDVYNNEPIVGEWVEPNAAKTKAIVIIPGMLGSSLEKTNGTKVWLNAFNYPMLELNENGASVNSIRPISNDNYGAGDKYKTLYNSLKNAYGATFDIIFFAYDFRKTNSNAAALLATRLLGYNEVVLIGHSMGGLVAGKFLASSAANRNKTAAYIAIGTPFVGSAKSINVMETGEVIAVPDIINSVVHFKETMRDMSRNCYAAYQLMPTSKYYTITGGYPITVNNVNYSNPLTKLKDAPWGKKSNGTTKPMFDSAITFHNSLFSSNVHVTNFSDVTTYTLAATGKNTISKVNFNSNFGITGLTYSNAGDETVLAKSAGYGTADYMYTGVNHVGMVSNSVIISRIKAIITNETGVAASNSTSTNDRLDSTPHVSEMIPDEVVMNNRGWIMGTDNKRINIYASTGATLLAESSLATEKDCFVFDSEGNEIGTVWNLGATGKKMYALYDGNYTITGSSFAKIEYMNDGYFEKVLEFSSIPNSAVLRIENFYSQTAESSFNGFFAQPDIVLTQTALNDMNLD